MCFIYTFSLSYRYTESRIDEKLVRLEFTTVSDFTVAATWPSVIIIAIPNAAERQKGRRS